jgi:uncharacterized membrane protein YfcA
MLLTYFARVALVGVLAGYFIGLVGIGAGVIMIPLLVVNGFTLEQAVAAGLMLQLVPQSLPAIYVYWKNNHVLVRECVLLIVTSMLGMFLGACHTNSGWLSKRCLYVILVAILAATGVYVTWTKVLARD